MSIVNVKINTSLVYEKMLYIHPVGRSSQFVTIDSSSMKPSMKVRYLTYYIYLGKVSDVFNPWAHVQKETL